MIVYSDISSGRLHSVKSTHTLLHKMCNCSNKLANLTEQ